MLVLSDGGVAKLHLSCSNCHLSLSFLAIAQNQCKCGATVTPRMQPLHSIL